MMSNNVCGECRACCVVLPIAEPAFVKPAGEPCKHLCASGCSIFGKPEWPSVCQDYYCVWRIDPWMGSRPLYRPDKLGVIFEFSDGLLSLWEVIPESLQSQQVQYIKGRLRGDLMVKNYPVGVVDGVRFDPTTVQNRQAKMPDQCEWEDLGGNEWRLRKKTNRIPLPLVA